MPLVCLLYFGTVTASLWIPTGAFYVSSRLQIVLLVVTSVLAVLASLVAAMFPDDDSPELGEMAVGILVIGLGCSLQMAPLSNGQLVFASILTLFVASAFMLRIWAGPITGRMDRKWTLIIGGGCVVMVGTIWQGYASPHWLTQFSPLIMLGTFSSALFFCTAIYLLNHRQDSGKQRMTWSAGVAVLLSVSSICFVIAQPWSIFWWHGLVLQMSAVGTLFVLLIQYRLFSLDNSEIATLLESTIEKNEAEALVAIDENGEIIIFNQGAVNMFGFSKEEILGQSLDVLVPAGQSFKHKPVIDTFGERGESHIVDHNRDLIASRKDGSTFPIVLSVTRLETKKGNMFTSIIRDASEQQRVHQYLAQAKEQAEEASKTKSEFLSVMSHELRTPMNGVLGMLGLLQRSELDKSQEKKVQLASDCAEHLLEIINSVLSMSKLESGQTVMKEQPFNLEQLLDEVVSMVAPLLENKPVELLIDTLGIDGMIFAGDAEKVRQILFNLIGNAAKFTDQGVIRVTVKVDDAENWLTQFEIQDTGIGIEEKFQEKLFESFSQADSSLSRRYEGTGLGLAIVSRLCDLMRGRIEVASEPGVGSCFSMRLFLNQRRDRMETRLAVIPEGVAVVDDHSARRELMEHYLGQLGISVNACGDEKITSATNRTLEDVAMVFHCTDFSPLTDGSGLEELRQNERYHSADVIRVCHIQHAMSESEYLAVGYQAQLTFPITRKQLSDGVTNVLKADFARRDISTPVRCPTEQKRRILIVDDQESNRYYLTELLTSLEMDVEVVDSGVSALHTLRMSDPFDLVIMDTEMNYMDGHEATRRIREGLAGAENAQVQVVAFSANALPGDKELCLEAGANDYIAQPITSEALKGRLVGLLGVG